MFKRVCTGRLQLLGLCPLRSGTRTVPRMCWPCPRTHHRNTCEVRIVKTVDFQGYHIHLHIDEEFINGLTPAEEDQEFNETPDCETIAKLIAEILPSYY